MLQNLKKTWEGFEYFFDSNTVGNLIFRTLTIWATHVQIVQLY